jgi:hypothetical protein
MDTKERRMHTRSEHHRGLERPKVQVDEGLPTGGDEERIRRELGPPLWEIDRAAAAQTFGQLAQGTPANREGRSRVIGLEAENVRIRAAQSMRSDRQ